MPINALFIIYFEQEHRNCYQNYNKVDRNIATSYFNTKKNNQNIYIR